MISRKNFGLCVALFLSTATLAAAAVSEPSAVSAKNQDCRASCISSFDADWLYCDYLPSPAAVVAECRREVNKKIDACMDTCVK